MKCFSLFSGIGGFDLALKRAGHTIIGACEIDKYARTIYARHFPGIPIHQDATKIKAEQLPDFELLCAGFPCQAFSIAGKRLGFEESRGTLFFEIARIARQKRPRLLLLENVKGLLSHDRGKTFANILATLDELGYDAEWQVLNSKYFVPQNRERIFIIGHLRGTPRPEIFPIRENLEGDNSTRHKTQEDGTWFRDKLVGAIDANYHKGYGTRTMIAEPKLKQLNDPPHDTGRIYDSTGIARALRANSGEVGSKTGLCTMLTEKRTDESKQIRKASMKNGRDFSPRRGKELVPRNDDLSNCITSGQSKEHLLLGDSKVRRLTPLECERLQGFPDEYTNDLSDTQRYKCLGNAVTVPVIEYILERLT